MSFPVYSSGLESSAAAAPSINVEILVGDKVVSLTATLDQDAHHAAKVRLRDRG